jgi:hypothetical protein
VQVGSLIGPFANTAIAAPGLREPVSS